MENRRYSCWWLGINNVRRRDRQSRVVTYPEIELFLSGRQETFRWPGRGRYPWCYQLMLPGDPVALWMGHADSGFAAWGIQAFARVLEAAPRTGPAEITLGLEFVPERPLTPFPQGRGNGPSDRTLDADFLWHTLGARFEPLFDVYSRLGYLPGPKRSIVTAFPVEESAFDRLVDRCMLMAA